MTEVTTTDNSELKQKLKERFAENQDKIEALYIEMGNCLMADIAVTILEKEPKAKTLVVFHMTVEDNEYNSIGVTSLLDENGNDMLDKDDELSRWVEDLLCGYSGDYLVLLPETIDLAAQTKLFA